MSAPAGTPPRAYDSVAALLGASSVVEETEVIAEATAKTLAEQSAVRTPHERMVLVSLRT